MTKREEVQKRMIERKLNKVMEAQPKLVKYDLESLIKRYLKKEKDINLTGEMYVSDLQDCYSVYWRNNPGDEDTLEIDLAPLFRFFLSELPAILAL